MVSKASVLFETGILPILLLRCRLKWRSEWRVVLYLIWILKIVCVCVCACVCARARAFSGNLRIIYSQAITRASQVALVGKGLPANEEDVRDVGSIPGSGWSPGGGHGNSLQCSCLENPMDRGVWRTTVHWVAKCWTQLKLLGTHTHTHTHITTKRTQV